MVRYEIDIKSGVGNNYCWIRCGDEGGKRVKTDSVGWFENKVDEEDGI